MLRIGPIGDSQAEPGSEPRQQHDSAAQVLKFVIEPACRAVGLEAVRADQMSRAGELTDQIFRALRDAPVVIADVTGGNPNVMYELGLRHSRDAITLQVGDSARLPFDISTIRTIMFVRTPESLKNAAARLEQMLRRALSHEFDHVAATKLWVEDGAMRTRPAPNRVPGKLERVHKMGRALAQMAENSRTGADILEQVSRLAQRFAADKRALDDQSAPYSQYEDVFREVESHLCLQADRAERFEGLFLDDCDHIVWGLEHLIDKFRRNPADPEKGDAVTLPAFLEKVTDAMHAVGTRSHKLNGFGDTHGSFREPVSRITRVFGNLPARVARFADLRAALLQILAE